MQSYEADIRKCVEVLQAGGNILYPTDTVWGLGCDATNDNAVQKVFELKHRPPGKTMIVLLAEAKDVLKFVAAPHPDIIDIVENFDTPTTVVYDSALNLADSLIAEDGSIAIRVVNDDFCKALIKRLQKPLVSTSANISGEPTPAFFKDVHPEIVNNVDYAVKYRQDDTTARAPSRIVRVQDDGSLQILRG